MKAESSSSHLTQRFHIIWQWLLGSLMALPDLEARRRSRLLSAMLLVLMPITTVTAIVVNWITIGKLIDFSADTVAIYAVIVLAVIYIINRAGHYLIAASLLVATFLVVPYAAVVLDSSSGTMNEPFLNVVATGIFVASIFIPRRGAIIIAAVAATVEIMLLPVFDYQSKNNITVIVAPVLTIWMVGALTLLYETHRTQLEDDRRQALQLALQHTEEVNRDLIKANEAANEATRLKSESEARQVVLIAGLRAVIATADELMMIADIELLYQRAVELAREKLGIERCAIFLEANATQLRGTYGTDMQGNTTDEHAATTEKGDSLIEALSKLGPEEPQWVIRDARQSYWTANHNVAVGHGWIGFNLIRSSDHNFGILFNDAAISGAPFDPVKQEIIVVFCSMLGKIIERRQIERTLQLSEERYRRLFNEIADTVIIHDLDGKILDVNEATIEHLGYSREELLQMNVRDIDQPDFAAGYADRIQARAKTGRLGHIQGVHKTRDGRLIDIDINSITINYDGQHAVLGVCRDISEQKRIEQHLRDLNQFKTEFLSTAAHELRTPLTSLVGFSELLITREMDKARQQHFLQIIHDQSVSLHRIVDSLLDISRLEAKQGLSLDIQSVNMADLVSETIASFAAFPSSSQIQVEGLADCPSVLGDRFRLGQVLQNLLSNAIKYSPNGGDILVRGSIIHDSFQLSVQDHGIGMTNEQQVHLFERFYRADTSNTTIGGTGLGLAICKLIIDLHGGKIWVESEYGVGTTLYCELPISKQLS